MNKNRDFRRAVAILSLFICFAGIHLFIFAQNIGIKYRITDLKVKLGELTSKNRQLGGLVAREENLAYVEKYAKGKLGMYYPAKIQYLAASAEGAPRKN